MGTTDTTATDVANGLRELADFIEGSDSAAAVAIAKAAAEGGLRHFTWDGAEFRAGAAALGGSRVKTADDDFIIIARQFGPVPVSVYGWRKSVCVRRVVGTRTEHVPASEAIPAQPARTVEREVVEWECPPILGGVS